MLTKGKNRCGVSGSPAAGKTDEQAARLAQPSGLEGGAPPTATTAKRSGTGAAMSATNSSALAVKFSSQSEETINAADPAEAAGASAMRTNPLSRHPGGHSSGGMAEAPRGQVEPPSGIATPPEGGVTTTDAASDKHAKRSWQETFRYYFQVDLVISPDRVQEMVNYMSTDDEPLWKHVLKLAAIAIFCVCSSVLWIIITFGLPLGEPYQSPFRDLTSAGPSLVMISLMFVSASVWVLAVELTTQVIGIQLTPLRYALLATVALLVPIVQVIFMGTVFDIFPLPFTPVIVGPIANTFFPVLVYLAYPSSVRRQPDMKWHIFRGCCVLMVNFFGALFLSLYVSLFRYFRNETQWQFVIALGFPCLTWIIRKTTRNIVSRGPNPDFAAPAGFFVTIIERSLGPLVFTGVGSPATVLVFIFSDTLWNYYQFQSLLARLLKDSRKAVQKYDAAITDAVRVLSFESEVENDDRLEIAIEKLLKDLKDLEGTTPLLVANMTGSGLISSRRKLEELHRAGSFSRSRSGVVPVIQEDDEEGDGGDEAKRLSPRRDICVHDNQGSQAGGTDGVSWDDEEPGRVNRASTLAIKSRSSRQAMQNHESRMREVSQSIQATLSGAHPKATYVLSDLFQKEMGEVIISTSALCMSLALFYWPTGIRRYIGFTNVEDETRFLDGMVYLAGTVGIEVLALVLFSLQISKVSSTHLTRVGLFFAMKHKRFYFLAMLCGVTWAIGLDLQHNGCDWCWEFNWLGNRTAEMGSYYRNYGWCTENATEIVETRCLVVRNQTAVCSIGPTF